MYSVTDPKILTRLVIDESGAVERLTWNDNKWVTIWSAPKECDTYGECGPNSYCDPYDPNKFRCTCLPGLEPRSTRDWNMRDGSGGCVRRQGVSTCRSGEGFVKLARVKVPDTSIARVDMSLSLEDCEQECLRNCSCMAYSSANETRGGIGCLSWHGDLMDIRTIANAGQDLYIRVDAVVLAQYAKKNGLMQSKSMVVILVVSIGLMLLLVVSIVYWLVMRRKKGIMHKESTIINLRQSEGGVDLVDLGGIEMEGLELQEAYFRGRKLQGTAIPIPQGYYGL
ncbi:hypothetical protein FH972_005130 [Carpinus fangiana]|uniref:Apple domain-containing protein n=1 Tax=Carpinus fangiana TaxID=176857 RepID=A0A5N6QQ44_9ROSI|nr:hypothetical protein FH972_005130 [Carpinus fangiana]